jgi:hypothetical protein
MNLKTNHFGKSTIFVTFPLTPLRITFEAGFPLVTMYKACHSNFYATNNYFIKVRFGVIDKALLEQIG